MTPIDENLVSISSSLNEMRLRKDDDKKISSRIAKVFGENTLAQDLSLTYSPSPILPNKRLANITNVENIYDFKKTLPFGLITFTPNKIDHTPPQPTGEAANHNSTEPMQHASPLKSHDGSSKLKANLVKVKKVRSNKKLIKKVTFKKTVQHKADSKKTRDDRDTAAISVYQTLNISRVAKQDDVKFKSAIAAKIREERMEEKESAASLLAETEKAKRQILSLRSKLFSDFTKQKGQRYRAEYNQRLENISKEMEFKSNIYVDHKNRLKEMADARRRKSVHIKALIRNEQKKFEEQRKMESKKIEHDSYHLKWEGEEDAKRYLEQMAEERRKSMAFRNEEGRRHRELEQQWKVEALQKGHEDETLMAAAYKDELNYKQSCEQARRESLAFRNLEGARHRAVMEELQEIVREKEHESFMLKWAGEDDAKRYLEQQAEERRKSFALRNKEGRRHRNLEQQLRVEAIRKAHEDEILMAAAHNDEEKYKQSCEEAKRESIALRNQDGFRQRVIMQEIRDVEKQTEHESFMLKWAGDDDAKRYLEQQAEERRKSLAKRNEEGRRHRELEAQMRVEALQRAHDEEVLKSAGK